MPGATGEHSADVTAQDSPYYLKVNEGQRLHQGMLLGHLREWTLERNESGEVAGIRPVIHRLTVVVSQDCDLAQDYQARESDPVAETDLWSILLCPAQPAEEMRAGRDEINSRFWPIVRTNRAERYHYLAEPPSKADLGPLLVDFKNHFSVRTAELYRQLNSHGEDRLSAIARLATPWREHFQHRFANYLSRIGLPRDHFVPESRRACGGD